MPNDNITAEPLIPAIRTDADGQHYLAGSRCSGCTAIFAGGRSVCARCFTRDRMSEVRLATRGTVYAFTIVHRSFPGVRTPFVAVTVDLSDGAHIRGTLENVAPTPESIPFDMPVELVFTEVVPPGAAGRAYLSYHFLPANGTTSGGFR
ncbi:OB-fold domain-containing protein [Nocardia sp. NBC_01377]|uniref:Zn-ribbon domain-containing OB-fold protein n=1 Tax=Nocardia sp. NBC_01377 TaxID=2903595 RepID=UPI0032534605